MISVPDLSRPMLIQAGLRSGLVWVLFVVVLTGCSTLPKDFERTPSYAVVQADDSEISQRQRKAIDAHPGKSGVYLLNNGIDAFVARAVLVEKATKGIDAQYYLYHNDLTGRLFTHYLVQAADRGVRVRLLVDDMDIGGRDVGAAVLDEHPNIEVRLFNPFSRGSPKALQLATRFGKVTRRMHNKSFTVDNAVTIVGGRNIGDEYFDADREMNFSDLDALAVGPVVNEVSTSFDEYWNSELSYPASVLYSKPVSQKRFKNVLGKLAAYAESQASSKYVNALHTSDFARRLREDVIRFDWVDARVVYDSPEKLKADRDARQYHLTPALAPYFRNVRKELIIISPYFIPGKSGTKFLQDLVARGVNVRILTNSLASTDVAVVHAGYARYRKQLLLSGVEIHESSPESDTSIAVNSMWGGSSQASLHTKSFIFDRSQVFIGSLNLDPRSIHENTEIGLIFDSKDIADDMVTWFDEYTKSDAYHLQLHTTRSGNRKIIWEQGGHARIWSREPESGWWIRLGVRLLRYFPLESQL